jgi:hypothetical protein
MTYDMKTKDYKDGRRSYFVTSSVCDNRKHIEEPLLVAFNACCDDKHLPVKFYIKYRKAGGVSVNCVGQNF